MQIKHRKSKLQLANLDILLGDDAPLTYFCSLLVIDALRQH